jgi:hypothetical protein
MQRCKFFQSYLCNGEILEANFCREVYIKGQLICLKTSMQSRLDLIWFGFHLKQAQLELYAEAIIKNIFVWCTPTHIFQGGLQGPYLFFFYWCHEIMIHNFLKIESIMLFLPFLSHTKGVLEVQNLHSTYN